MSNIKKRGFASLSPQRRQELARMGGIESHRCKRAHTFTHDEAVAAGKKGHAARMANAKRKLEQGF